MQDIQNRAEKHPGIAITAFILSILSKSGVHSKSNYRGVRPAAFLRRRGPPEAAGFPGLWLQAQVHKRYSQQKLPGKIVETANFCAEGQFGLDINSPCE